MLGTYSHTLLQQIMTSTWPSETIMIQLDVNLQGLLLQCYNGRKLLDSQETEFTKRTVILDVAEAEICQL